MRTVRALIVVLLLTPFALGQGQPSPPPQGPPKESEDLAPDAKDYARTERWFLRQALRLSDTANNEFAREKIQKATRDGMEGLKGRDVEWTFTVGGIGKTETDGPHKGMVVVALEQQTSVRREDRKPGALELVFGDSPRLYVKAEDWLAAVRRGQPVRVAGTVAEVSVGDFPLQQGKLVLDNVTVTPVATKTRNK